MKIHFIVIGYLLMILALLHTIFPKYFHWKKELSSLSTINRQIMYVHSFFIALAVFLVGLLCVTSYNDLLNTVLGQRICLGLAIFWMLRLLVQFWGYSRKTWKGKIFETIVHILLSIFWTYLTVIFIFAYFRYASACNLMHYSLN